MHFVSYFLLSKPPTKTWLENENLIFFAALYYFILISSNKNVIYTNLKHNTSMTLVCRKVACKLLLHLFRAYCGLKLDKSSLHV